MTSSPLVRNMFAMLALMMILPFLSSPALAQTKRVVAYGDSLMAGYQLPPGQGFVPQLEAALKEKKWDVTIINAAVSGDTTAGGLRRIDAVLALKPDMVLLELGANDALRGLPPEKAKENLANIITRLKQEGVSILIMGMKAPRNMGNSYAQEFDAIYPDLAKEHKLALYPFFLEAVATNPGLNLPDGMHPNAAGIQEIVKRIIPAIINMQQTAGGYQRD